MHDDFNLGPTGAFPDGQIHPEDEGELRMALGHDQGNVVLDFGKPVRWLAFPPANARQLAAMLIKHAHAVDGQGPILEFHEGPTS
jgi:hypothetical protein